MKQTSRFASLVRPFGVKLYLVVALVGCSAPAPRVDARPPTPTPHPTGIDCANLPPCTPDLGVCLRCVSPDHPIWVWNHAPGSPWTLRVPAHVLPDPTPGLEIYVGYPFSHGPSCTEFELDHRGLPVRTRRTGHHQDVHAWTYDARGRVIEERVDKVPFCPINDYGTEGPCGEPDGTWDQTTRYRWRDLPSGGAIVDIDGGFQREYDARGRLVRSTPPTRIRTTDVREVEHEYRGDRLVMTRTNVSTTTYTYDTAGRLVERQLTRSGSTHATLWSYDTTGNLTQLGDQDGLTYANTYRHGRLVSIRTSSRGNIQMSPPIVEAIREHDARGLLVRLTTSAPGVHVMAEQRWTRDERGVPTAASGVGPDADYRCLAHLADAQSGPRASR
jgi:YD repeat-containing protein